MHRQTKYGRGGGKEMDNWFKSPWFIRVISLLLAIAMYVSVSIDKEGENQPLDTIFSSLSDESVLIRDVPLQVKIDEEKFVVLGVPPTVNVAIEGSKSQVTTAERTRNFDVFIDLTDLDVGTHEVDVQYSGFNNQLKVATDPETIAVTIEERGTSELEVELELLNQDTLDEELQLGTPVITPSTVEVTGSVTEVNKIAMVKAIVDLSGITDDVNIKNAPVKVYDQQGNELNVFVNPSSVSVEIPLQVGKKELPISYTTTGELPDGISLQSISLNVSEVSVYGQASVLAALETLDDLTINLSDITEDTTLELEVPTPPGATRVDPIVVEVTIDVEETSEKVLADIPIEVLNLSGNRELTFIDPEEGTVTITIFGTSKQLEDITVDDFSVSIDVTGFISGEFETPIQIEGPETLEFTSNVTNAHVSID